MVNHQDRGAETDESAKERIDRELLELLYGLKVIIPGVQVLFAFLLAVPFASGFVKADAFQRDLLLVAAVAAAVSAVLLIAPAAQHRVLFRAGVKEELLHRANRFAVVGTLSLGIAMVAALLLLLDYLFSRSLAIAVCAAVAALLLWSWQIQPAISRARSLKN
ncbi:MAG: hypothetical protein H0T78_04560 [Longispora sp.]|nr:hypothetical protein [Longispora sp. (in: high G+C Gram-positive bacteria)]